MVAINRSGSNGLTIHPVAPATPREIFLVRFALGREHQNGRRIVRGIAAHLADHFVAVHPRHVDVGDDHVDLLFTKHIEAVLTIDGLQDLETGVCKRQHQHVADRFRVVDSQDSLGHRGVFRL